MNRYLAPFAALVLVAASTPALAWSALGHRLVGELAERQLSPEAKAEVARLLAGEKEPTLAGVSTWADELRSSSPEAFKRTAPWHYVKLSEGTCRFERARECKDGDCVIGAIEAQRDILADAAQPLEARRDALKFLVHFVGDVHQPMHANHRDDKGGNDYQISLRTPLQPEEYARKHYADGVMGTNLHSIWDYYLLASRGLDFDAYADRLATPWPPKKTPIGAPAAWATESCGYVEAQKIYPKSHKLDHRYLDAKRPLAEQRVRQGAHRLATLLNESLAR
ncbi:S1/P1 nuclease [Cognatilysobacter bugurensis]|uniref:Endonuclease n=1 Tax=Cognatilysobacter bugurensis TaxID=543356 RepID=A0A918W874_9GAMM|nr:S1/P1 nuclease [Lysobacter bugurensis]GHA84613.1 endonuclease [Lysobacter bugurensis]